MSAIGMPDLVSAYALARLAVFAAAALVIAALFRRERPQVGQAIILCAIAIAARIAGAVSAALELEAFERMNNFIALLLLGMAFLTSISAFMRYAFRSSLSARCRVRFDRLARSPEPGRAPLPHPRDLARCGLMRLQLRP